MDVDADAGGSDGPVMVRRRFFAACADLPANGLSLKLNLRPFGAALPNEHQLYLHPTKDIEIPGV